jgi:uncharacterized membrane protein (UPF0182 family)
MLMLFFSAVMAGAVYGLNGGIDFDDQRWSMSPAAIAHGSVLLALFFLVKAWSYGLDRFLLLYGDNGVVVGASYTDVHVELPVLWLLVGLAVVASLASLANVWMRTYKLPRLPPCWSSAAPWCSARYSGPVSTDICEAKRAAAGEALSQHNISSTQQAYNLQQIAVKPFPAEQT